MSFPTKWLATSASDIDCLCLGTGRFLRSVLVPALVEAGFHPALVQTRGRSMLEYMLERERPTYEVDTVLTDGNISTEQILCWGAFSLGTSQDKQALLEELLPHMKTPSIIGVGVTEAGLASSSTQVMKNLYELLQHCHTRFSFENNKLCVIDMDNVPNNGQVIQSHMLELARDDADIVTFLKQKVAFLDTMVDRITSQREGSNGMVPRCEPTPAKALVILDIHDNLPPAFRKLPKDFGVVVRSTAAQLQGDIALKLRVANGTHTAMAHAMALSTIPKTDIVISPSAGALWMSYVDSLFEQDILVGATPLYGKTETKETYQDWRRRLCHAHFGLSTFFITQNGDAKGGIRLGPTVTSLLLGKERVTVAMAYAFAAILRWLTPCHLGVRPEGVYRGWLDGAISREAAVSTSKGEAYADGLRHDLQEKWYEFRCVCGVHGRPLAEWLAELTASPQQPQSHVEAIRAYLTASDGGNLSSSLLGLDDLVQAVATLYARMVVGDGMTTMLEEMKNGEGVYSNGFATDCRVLIDGASLDHGRPLSFRKSPVPASSKLMQSSVPGEAIPSVVVSEVASAEVIDLHTHLLPPSHGSLCCWGIDELLTYVRESPYKQALVYCGIFTNDLISVLHCFL